MALVLAAVLAGAAPAAAAPIVVVDERGGLRVERDPFLPPATVTDTPASGLAAPPPAPGPEARRARGRATLPSELRRLERAGALSAADAAAYAAQYRDARRVARKLPGPRRTELAAVLRNAEAMASDGLITASRVKPLLETIRRNREWFADHPPLAFGRRIRFRGSRLVWQAYPGQGIQIQWLGTFGRMNGLFAFKGHDVELGEIAREVGDLAVERAGGIAWEYLFRFGGGRPPWVSGLAQGTGIQALSRTAIRRRESRWFEVAREALGIFRAAPPSGVRVAAGAGAHYLAYSYAPRQRIYNAFLQAVIGLHDFAAFANDPLGRRLYLDGERRARIEVRRSDTGSWSLYQPGVPSDIGYHKVLRDFARGLCDRLVRDREREAQELRERTGDPGRILRGVERWPDPEPYCVTSQRFTRYLYARLRALGQPTPY